MAADTSDPSLKQVLAEIKNPGSSTNWVLFGYEKQTVKIRVAGKGDGGLAELSEDLNDGKVLFGLIKYTIKGVDKFVYLTWCGEGVIGMMKGRFNNHCKDMERFLTGSFHIQVNARTEKDVDDNLIRSRLVKAMGANFDAGQKNQGQKQGGVTTVAEGVQKVTNPKARPITKIDQGNVGLDQKDQFWEKQRAREEKEAAAKTNLSANRLADVDAAKNQREKFWAQNPEPKAPERPSRPEYNKKAESDQYWAKLNAEEEARKNAGGSAGPAPVNTGATRNIRAAFEQKAAPASAPPPRPAPKVAARAPPPPAYEEPAYEEQQYEEQQYEEQPAYEEQQYEEQPAYEEQQYEEQQYEEQPAYEEPAYEEPAYEEPAYEEPAAEETYEQPAEEYQEQAYEEAPAEQGYGAQARALYDYAGEAEGDLVFSAGDIITVLDQSDPSGWWQGELNGASGVFPANFVELVE